MAPFGATLVFDRHSRRPTVWRARFLQAAGFLDRRGKEKRVLNSTASQPQTNLWLAANGPKELESLFRAIVFHPSAPILLADDDRNYTEASVGAGKLLGMPRAKIIGKSLDDFADPGFKPVLSERWRAFLEEGEQVGTLPLIGPDGTPREVEYTAKGNVLPVRHLLVLRDKNKRGSEKDATPNIIPPWVQDYALFLLDAEGQVAAWYAGAERIYGYKSEETAGRHVSFLYASDGSLRAKLDEELRRAAAEGHLGNEGWQVKNDGSRFWANVITMSLKDEDGDVAGLRPRCARF